MDDAKTIETEKRPEWFMLCNRAILGVLVVMNFFTGFVAFLGICYGFGGDPMILFLWQVPFIITLTLSWGHKRVIREAPLSQFSRVFWPLVSILYFGLIFAFFWSSISTDQVPVDRVAEPEHGFGYFLFALAICCLPAILSLPPFVFTMRLAMKVRQVSRQ